MRAGHPCRCTRALPVPACCEAPVSSRHGGFCACCGPSGPGSGPRGPTPVTTAVPTDVDGVPIGPEILSGRDGSDRVNRVLRRAYGEPDYATWAAAEHAEPKVALWMNDNGITFSNVVINQNYICGGDGGAGCLNVLPALLEQGRSMRVWYRDAEGILQRSGLIHGTAPRGATR
ncbi:DddA-like double-stranded DNA deaminase toxin [Actinacidiphila glaucinigra]|uniref:DddA-like double-stranded DNA deaminase toxin n=1 Tax=Actinacidiphila glaucinigra TaxID=235986 RepID=UPI00366FDC7E